MVELTAALPQQFVDALAKRIVPDCDVDVVRAVFDQATQGYTGPRHRDGRRVSWLTPSGLPFEASVSGGGGRPDPVLRYATETASGVPFFVPKLAAQLAALTGLVERLPGRARADVDELRGFVDTVLPEPAAVPARTRFATSVGFLHRADEPQHVARLKLYANLGICPGAIDRLAATWRAYGDLAARVEGLQPLLPHIAALEVDAESRRSFKLYFGCRGADEAFARVVAARFAVGVDIDGMDVEPGFWRRRYTIGCASSESGEHSLSFYLPVRSLGLAPGSTAAFLRGLSEHHHGTTVLFDALMEATSVDPHFAWRPTIVSFTAGSVGITKLNVYVAPQPA